MSVHLVGGGQRTARHPDLYRSFVAEASRHAEAADRTEAAERLPRVAIVTVREDAADGHAAHLADAIGVAGRIDAVFTRLALGDVAPASAFDEVDGVVIGGGLTPAYLTAVRPHAARLQALVTSGVPYLGFSAGAMIAPDRALIGGWRIDGVEVAPEDASEDLDEVTVEEGLGLIDVTVDVHAVQWGNLARLTAAVDAGIVGEGIAVDEHTALTVGGGPLRVTGAGTVWALTHSDDGVRVRAMR